MSINTEIPLMNADHDDESIVNPQDFISYQKRRGKLKLDRYPETVFICFNLFVRDIFREVGSDVNLLTPSLLHGRSKDGNEYLVNLVGVGAPMAVATIEELFANGARKFISIGSAGAIRSEFTIGDIVVPTFAVRDEGTSYHYLPPARYVDCKCDLGDGIAGILEKNGMKVVRCGTWTTDAPYRETRGKRETLISEGVGVVEMEVSAISALSKFRGFETSSVLVVSDVLGEKNWTPAFGDKRLRESLKRVIATILKEIP